MAVQIQFSSDASPTEFEAVIALISVLRNRNDHSIVGEPQPVEAPGEPGPASSSESGQALPPSISATVPPAPVPHQTVSQLVGDEAVLVSVPLPPAPPVPVAGVAPPPVSSGAAVALDSEGLPWDARIHSASRNQTAKGAWARRRNTPDDKWDAVRAELRQAMAAPAAPTIDAATAFAVPPPPVPVAAVSVPLPPTPPAAPAPTASDTPADTAAVEPAPVVDSPINALLVRITGAQTAGTLRIDEVQAVLTGLGLTSIRDLMKRPDLVGTVETALFQ